MQVGAATLEKIVESPLEIKIELPHDPAIALLGILLGIFPKDTHVVKRRATCTPMFIAAMATVTNYGKNQDALQRTNG